MKINLHKIKITITLLVLCFSLSGCGSKNQGTPLDQAVSQNQLSSSVGSGSITPTDDKENIDTNNDANPNAGNVVDQNSNNIDEQIAQASDNQDTNDGQDPEAINKASELVFEETSETVYATVNVNIRSSYTTNADNVVALLEKGSSIKRFGLNTKWSKVLYQNEVCYIKTDYLTLEKLVTKPSPTIVPTIVPTASNETSISEEDFISNLSIASDINQLVCIVGNGGSDCTVSLHSKGKNGTWKQQFSIDGDCGSKGISYDKEEGDNQTPAGLFSFTLAFGINSDPGSLLPYRQITNYDYWVDDGTSPYYNTWVNSKETPGDFSSEHLIDHDPSYRYALHLNYNSECTPGLGSAIFLHGYNGSGSTTGCIAISEDYVKLLIQTVDSSTKVLIIPNSKDLSNY